MNFSIGIRLYWRAGRNIFGIIFFIFVASLIASVLSTNGLDRDFNLMVSKLSLIALIIAVLVVWLKYRRGILAVASGQRREATVLGIRVNSRNGNDPVNYVLTWVDTDRFEGSSLPDSEISFEDLKPGDPIIVYKNNDHDSWWQRDIFGPPVAPPVRNSDH